MSNYHVEPAAQPAALTKEAIKSLRKEQVQGLSRRQLMRVALGSGIGLFTLEALAGTVAFAWPNLRKGFGGVIKIGTLDEVKSKNTVLPIADGFPAYSAEAKAFIVTIDPSRHGWLPGSDPTGDGTALNVRALSQRCPHLGCRPNPCLEDFWLRCPCHQSRYDRLGTKIAGEQYGPAPHGMNRYAVRVDADGVLFVDTSRLTLGPLPIALGEPGVIPPLVENGCV